MGVAGCQYKQMTNEPLRSWTYSKRTSKFDSAFSV